MDDKERFGRIARIVAAAVAGILMLSLLGYLTSRIYVAKKQDELRTALELVLSERGEKGVFELAGIPVGQLEYSGASLYPSERGAWTYSDDELGVIAVFEDCRDKVVQIISQSMLSDRGQGAGVLLSSDGYILTNRHVVADGETFSVNFYDGTTVPAVLVGSDSLTDIAVLKADVDGLEPMFLSSSSPVVGQTAFALGHPYGYTWSFSKGIVSGTGRTIYLDDGGVVPGMIQTDALINPGNSGGPLIDSRGDMLGLVSSIYSSSGSAEGISFALPSETVGRVAEQLIREGRVSRGWIDVFTVDLNPQIVEYSSLPVDHGLLVSQTVAGGLADKAGIRGGKDRAQYGSSVIYLGGDVIVRVNGVDIYGYADYFAALFGTSGGDVVEVVVQRGDKQVVLEVPLVEQTEENVRWILR